jgi:hypothetical protein
MTPHAARSRLSTGRDMMIEAALSNVDVAPGDIDEHVEAIVPAVSDPCDD